uniref:Uncharacterized protein n=1 Tax=Rhodopseudomonas palustris (strain BisA53) TaxID=316055 RepID=Q07KB4_RHOP5
MTACSSIEGCVGAPAARSAEARVGVGREHDADKTVGLIEDDFGSQPSPAQPAGADGQFSMRSRHGRGQINGATVARESPL